MRRRCTFNHYSNAMNRLFSAKFPLWVLLFLGTGVLAQSMYSMFSKPNITGFPGEKYLKDWAKVDSLEGQGLTKQASEQVQVIYGKAKTAKNTPQIVKTLIYSLKYKSELEEDAQENFLKDLDTEIGQADPVLKSVLYSIKGEIIWWHYQSRRWVINGRTPGAAGDEDIKTWDAGRFMDESRRCYMLSLENEKELKEVPIEKLEDILEVHPGDRLYRPTLFDFLAHRAIDHFMNAEANLNRPAYAFALDNASYFSPYGEFIRLDPQTADSTSAEWFAFRLFQRVLAFHSGSGNTAALLDADMKRLDFVKSNFAGTDKDNLHLKALEALEARFASKDESADVTFRLAQTYVELGAGYKPGDKDDTKKNYLKKAVELCDRLLKNRPDSRAGKNAAVLKKDIRDPYFSFTSEWAMRPDVPNLILFNFKNLDKAHYRLVSVDYTDYQEKAREGDERFKKWLAERPSVKSWSQSLPNDGLYHQHAAELELPPLKKGFYILLTNDSDSFNAAADLMYAPFFVSNLACIKRVPYGEGSFEALVTDAETGVPVPGAEVKLYKDVYDYTARVYKKQTVATLKTNNMGMVSYAYSAEQYLALTFTVRSGDDFLADPEGINLYRNRYRQPTYVRTSFFTDRGIYRPGQTVYFKGIKIRTDGEKNDLVTNTSTEVTFRDANYQEITKQRLEVNDFGSLQGSFTIPQGLATGMYTISDANGSVGIRVEEYKRPKFEVTVKKPADVFRINDKVTIKGNAKALAGFNITDAKVQYRVYRTANYPIWCRYWFPVPDSEEQEITFGVTKTDDKGEFSIDFTALPDAKAEVTEDVTYTYRVSAEVTDEAGETRTAEESITAGYATLKISALLPDLQSVSDDKPWSVFVYNLNDQKQKQTVEIKIERLVKQPLLRSKLWALPDVFLIPEDEYRKKFPYDVYKMGNSPLLTAAEETVFEGSYDTADSLGFKTEKRKSWKPGAYRVVMRTKDPFGKDVKSVQFFTLYDEKEKASPVNEFFTARALDASVEPGKEARFFLASSKNVRVLFEVERKNGIATKEWITLNNEQRIIKVPVIEEDRGNIQVTFSAVFAGRSYLYALPVYVPYTNKQLEVKLESFRDKMLPGSKEEWRIKVSPLLGERQTAELLLGMYDASLDAFVPNHWYLNVWNSRYGKYVWSSGVGKVRESDWLNVYYDEGSIELPVYENLNWFDAVFFSGGYGLRGDYYRFSVDAATAAPAMGGAVEEVTGNLQQQERKEEKQKAPSRTKNAEMDESNASYKWRAGDGESDKSIDGLPGDGRGTSDVKARSNFNETAFFFPQIKTDAEGNAVFSFTMPESLTKWKFMGMAHTKTLQTGTVTQEVVTQKELMINTFAPRFLREGDELLFTGKVTNLTEKELTGKAVLELKNPLTDKSIAADFALAKAEVPFTVKPGQSVPVEWRLKVPFGAELVKYTVKAVSGNFADGEENVIPVLSNRMLVTETVPLWVNGNDTRNFALPKLNTPTGTQRNHKLTLEFTSNPAWYAVQALPYLMEYPYECAEQTFSRLYANSIATHIANSDPKIKAVFDTWKNYQPEALQSNLEKNQDLKNVLLEESPWVREAKNETERKRRVGILFDLNRMKNELASAERKLQQMQTPNGGFPWFKDGPDDRYITQHIVAGFGKLRRLGINDSQNKNADMVRSAVLYLDKRMAEDYQNLMKYKMDLNADNLGHTQMHYLYARSYFKDIPVDESCRKEAAYFLGQAEKYWNKKDDYGMGMLAVALHRMDKPTVAKQIVASLKDRSIYNEELGMYWKGMLQGGYYWYNAPIETMALLMEAFDEVTDDTESLDKMRRWLLKNKQTNDWKTTKATADASYALLMQGTGYLMTEPGVEISFGKNGELPFVLPAKTEAGTGYFKTDFYGSDIKPQMANVRVTKKTAGPGWGSLYWQYFEDLDKITKPQTPNPLTVSKKLFKEVKTDRGPKLEEIMATTSLEPGDRVISRVILTSDRPMEYVHLKDMRASGLEPENVLSQYKWQQGLGYYESTRDVATHFFISYVPRGTYVFEYPSRVTHRGNFSNGITQVQCMYAPEFTFHSEGIRVNIK